MSYSKSFHASVSVSGTVSIHYPASESGGVATANYYDTVPIDWTVYVDTDPFDSSVARTEMALDALTGSVVALNAAQIESIRCSSQKVAGSLSSGFFRLIGKDLSENMVAQVNTIRSKFALLMQYSKDLLAKQERMDEDVARLRRHYSQVFLNLDEDLNRRVSAIDSPAFTLGERRRQDLLTGPYLQEAAFCLDGVTVGDRTGNQLVRARTNGSVAAALEALNGYVRKNLAYKAAISDVLEGESAEKETKEYVPVLFIDSEDMNRPDSRSVQCVPPRMNNEQRVTNVVSRQMQQLPDDAWSVMRRDELDRIDRNFCNYVEQDSQADSSSQSDRVHQEILRMWNLHKNNLKENHER